MGVPVLRDGGILLHIGPHKTGTTAIQGALAAARDDLARSGIDYPGRRVEHNRPAAAAIQRSLGWDRRKIDPGVWTSFAEQVRKSRGRVVLSSEVFCEASPESARLVVTDLEPERVQVVVTLRPLEKLLPSNWQQYIKSGYRVRYEHWLESVLESRDARTVTPSFWVRNHHPRVIRRWADVVGAANVIVVIVDSAQPRSLFDAFEGLLQLPQGTLSAEESGRSNRSLSAPEVELLRQFNRRARHKVSHTDYYRFVKQRAVRNLVEGRTPGPGEARVKTPGWAVERAREFSKSDVAEIGAMGVQVVGDLEALAPTTPVPTEQTVERIPQVPTALAATFLYSLFEAGIEVVETTSAEGSAPSLLARVRRRLPRRQQRDSESEAPSTDAEGPTS